MKETTAAQIEDAAGNLFRIMRELAEARADVALLVRLKSAETRVGSLLAEHAVAVAKQEAVLAAEAAAKERARFAALTDINVVDKRPEQGVLSSVFTINYHQLRWDIDAHASPPALHTVTGFTALPRLVLEYLIERHPTKIPAKILALAPSSPWDAFETYFAGLRRGYLKGVVA